MEEQVQQLIDEAKAMPHCLAQVTVLEQALRLADSHQLGRLQYTTRNELINAVIFTGQGHKAMPLFSWVLNYYDEHEDEMSWRDRWYLMWRYKWVAGRLPDFYQVPLNSIFDAIDDMKRRYELYGFDTGPIHKRLMWIYLDIGEDEKAHQAYEDWMRTERSIQSDCAACDLNSKVSFWHHMKDYQKAYSLSEPLISGEMGCECVPHSTYGKILEAALEKDGQKQADQYHQRGYEMIRPNISNYYTTLRHHLVYLCKTAQYAELNRLLDEHFVGMLEQDNPLSLLFVYRALHRVFETLKTFQPTIALRASEKWPLYQTEQSYQTEQLAQWFGEQGRQIAGRFDARNQNTYYMQWFDDP